MTCAAVRMRPPPSASRRITAPDPVLLCAVLVCHGLTQSGSRKVTRSLTTALYSSRSKGRSSSSKLSLSAISASSSAASSATTARLRVARFGLRNGLRTAWPAFESLRPGATRRSAKAPGHARIAHALIIWSL